MELIEISIDELNNYINIAFNGDTDLFSKYHIKGGTQEDCVFDTHSTIVEASDLFDTTCYKVLLRDEPIGFTVVSKKLRLLYSFGINKEYRKKEILELWFENVVNILGVFNCYLWNINSRGITHLLKQGMTQVDSQPEYVQLKYEKCH